MEYKDKEYIVTLTYQCENCGAVDFVNPDKIENLRVNPSFLAFALDGGPKCPVSLHKITHICSKSHDSTVIGPMKFITADIRGSIKSEEKASA
ncbi:hypothetical protein KAR91_48890 [Candidatus Pacearchaeota archaeon]|nr:hypothetical protein [Candidatus Pacearchaeota archaeon]